MWRICAVECTVYTHINECTFVFRFDALQPVLKPSMIFKEWIPERGKYIRIICFSQFLSSKIQNVPELFVLDSDVKLCMLEINSFPQAFLSFSQQEKELQHWQLRQRKWKSTGKHTSVKTQREKENGKLNRFCCCSFNRSEEVKICVT